MFFLFSSEIFPDEYVLSGYILELYMYGLLRDDYEKKSAHSARWYYKKVLEQIEGDVSIDNETLKRIFSEYGKTALMKIAQNAEVFMKDSCSRSILVTSKVLLTEVLRAAIQQSSSLQNFLNISHDN